MLFYIYFSTFVLYVAGADPGWGASNRTLPPPFYNDQRFFDQRFMENLRNMENLLSIYLEIASKRIYIQIFLGEDLHTLPWFVDGVCAPFLKILDPRLCSVAYMFFKTKIKFSPLPPKKKVNVFNVTVALILCRGIGLLLKGPWLLQSGKLEQSS